MAVTLTTEPSLQAVLETGFCNTALNASSPASTSPVLGLQVFVVQTAGGKSEEGWRVDDYFGIPDAVLEHGPISAFAG